MNHRTAAPSFLPSTAVLEMTYQCNHKCLFCSCPWFGPGDAYEKKEELDKKAWMDLIEKLGDMGVCNFAFTGGEPLLKAGIEELIGFTATRSVKRFETQNDHLVSRVGPPSLYLLTNGHAMTDEILELCRHFQVNLSMSLPGIRTYKEHTSGGDPENILKWFEQASEMGVTSTVGVTVTKKNLHELYETISAAFLAGADRLLMNRFLPGGRGITHGQELSLNEKEVKTMLDLAEQVLIIANRKGSVGTELPKCLLNGSQYEHLHVGTRCSAAIDFFVIDPSGYVRTCNHSPVRINHVTEIESLKNNPYWKRFVFKDYLPDTCGGCSLISSCDGGCREAAHIVGGSLDSKDPILSSERISS